MTDTTAEWRSSVARDLVTAAPSSKARVLNSVLHCCEQTNLYAWSNKIPLPRTTANRVYTLGLVKCCCEVTVISRISIRATQIVTTPNKFAKILGKSDITNGIISDLSPVGAALIGKKVGEIAEAHTPTGAVVRLKVLAISK